MAIDFQVGKLVKIIIIGWILKGLGLVEEGWYQTIQRCPIVLLSGKLEVIIKAFNCLVGDFVFYRNELSWLRTCFINVSYMVKIGCSSCVHGEKLEGKVLSSWDGT